LSGTKSPRSRPKRLPIALSHADKVFWPDEGYTKRDLVDYYAAAFPRLRPYVTDRLLSFERCPDGIAGKCFFQKQKPKGLPLQTSSQRLAHVADASKSTEYVVGGSLETQLAMANLGCIAVHVMASRASAPRLPDWICVDIDPESGEFADAARAALRVKAAFDELSVETFVKTSGNRGLHVFVPIRVGPDAREALDFAKAFTRRVAAAFPLELTVEQSVAARHGRVYLDPFRNGYGQTVVAPHSVRRRAAAPISTPLAWTDVVPSLDPVAFNLGNFASRSGHPDPWSTFFERRQSLDDVRHRLEHL